MILFNFIKYFIIHIKYTLILSKIIKEENLLENLSKLLGTTLKKDWIGRIYTVINPNITNGVYDQTTQVFEYGEGGLNNESYIERWIMQRLNIASEFIKINNLFDILTYNIKKLDNYDNYLFVLYPISLVNFKKYLKLLPISLIIIIGAIITYFVY